MMERYKHTQASSVTLVAGGLGLLTIVGLGSWTLLAEFDWVTFGAIVAAGIVLAMSLLLFSTLTVAISGGILEVRFGPVRLIRKRFALHEIESC